MSTEAFTCESCGGTFPKEWSDEEAMAESKTLWGEVAPADLAVICDDCFVALRGGSA